MAENRVQTPTLGRGTDTSDDPTVHYEHEWKQLNLENQHGQALSDLYELTEKVTWMQGNQKNEQRAEIYLYLPAPGAQTTPGAQQ